MKKRAIPVLSFLSTLFLVLGCLLFYFGIYRFFFDAAILGLGALSILGSLITLVMLVTILFRTSRKEAIQEVAHTINLINNGLKIPIDLDHVRIKSNSWNEKKVIETTIYDIDFDEERTQTILEIDTDINGTNQSFHLPTKHNPKTLEMYFAIQKTTFLYVDPANPAKFYLDLNFIP